MLDVFASMEISAARGHAPLFWFCNSSVPPDIVKTVVGVISTVANVVLAYRPPPVLVFTRSVPPAIVMAPLSLLLFAGTIPPPGTVIVPLLTTIFPPLA